MKDKINNTYSVIPLRKMVVVPNTVTPILVGRKASIKAVEAALVTNKELFCVSQKKNYENETDPQSKDLYRIGTICTVLQTFKLPDGNLRILVHGEERAIVQRFSKTKDYIQATVEENPKQDEEDFSLELEARLRVYEKQLKRYVKLSKTLPKESLAAVNDLESAEDLIYFGIANIDIDFQVKQKLYEDESIKNTLENLTQIIDEETEILELENQIESKLKKRINKLQKEYYLHEQLKIIRKELGIAAKEETDIIEFKEKLNTVNLSNEARKKAEEEIDRLAHMNHQSQEYSVVYNYLNWLFSLPWEKPEHNDYDLAEAQKILDKDHYGLKKVKDRILEFLAVMKLTNKVRGQIICFVGPPGVGKTSLGKSIAKAIGRKFVRLSLGGVRDEAEIRGHRRTYIGSLPGIIMQSLKKAGTKNPLIMMDEVDKMSVDFRGDPSAALLEVLDPEQNNDFRDHFLDFGYDLSDVMFITTANTLNSIPDPLLDRMEIIELPGYTENEKLAIAEKHLLPRTLLDHEVEGKIDIKIPTKTIQKVIRSYTRESGVRTLERKIATLIRKVIKQHFEGSVKKSKTISEKFLTEYLGVEKRLYSKANKTSKVGVVTGLAWTMSGGETLQIEVLKLDGEGKFKVTGQLGEVMKESASAAYSLARKFAKKYKYSADFTKKTDLHLHIPEGAVPKDGPSAGITMTTALVSALSGKKVNHDVAMTGEVTLTGEVLAIGGLAEKLIAAKRSGIKKVLIPKANEPHFTEVAEEIKQNLEVVFVSKIDEVLNQSLV